MIYRKGTSKQKSVAFLHPYCGGGGGGERVLWDAIIFMMKQKDKLKFSKIIIYSAFENSRSHKHERLAILKKVKQRFDIEISNENLKFLQFIPLRYYWVIQPKYHPFATLLLQSLAAIILAIEGLYKFTPHIFIDTTGYAFSYPIAGILFGCKVVSYTHYPTISSDMLNRVSDGVLMYNNKARYASNRYLRFVKYLYYKLFSYLYGLCGYFADIVMVNSTWTYNHVNSIFFRSSTNSILKIIYPPCGNSDYLSKFDLKKRKKVILSVGQFRPEKDHPLQVEAFYKFIKKCKSVHGDCKLIIVGGVRDISDKKRVTKLRVLIKKYDLNKYIEIKENLDWNKLLKLFETSFIGLHTMNDEHFGICLTEYMIAGLVTIGHCSGGPLSDIISNNQNKIDIKEKKIETNRGFLCTTVDQYAYYFEKILNEYDDGNGWLEIRQNARKYCNEKFSCLQFQKQFVETIKPLFVSTNNSKYKPL